MTAVLLGHAAVLVAVAALGGRVGARVFWLAALAPAAGFGYLVAHAGEVLDGRPLQATGYWAPALQLELALRADPLALVLALLVTGVGALVLGYAGWYFRGEPAGHARTAAVLTGFAGSMLGLVLADHVLVLYLFWELTTVASFLLIGGDGRSGDGRRAAVRALLVTTGTGFAMLLGLLLLGRAAGTYRLGELVTDPPAGGAVTVAVLLVLVGVVGKSALVPLHSWLPDAMVAPTPVSAYLHAAAMVKAGVFLVARLAPGFADVPGWRPVLLGLGLLTMLLGGWRALAEHDLKRVLAYGTIAQLGFLTTLLAAGTRTAAVAGLTLLVAHALFKATLFLVVGIIDHSAGTRDLRELSGLGRRAPVLLAVAVLASASMAGLPPFLGYLGKEAALAAFADPGGPVAPLAPWVLAGLTAGSALTVGYTLRFLWGAFAGRPGTDLDWRPPPAGFLAAPLLLAGAGLAVGLLPDRVDPVVAAYAGALPGTGQPYHLALWHGLGLPVLLSAVTLVAGALLHVWRARPDAVRAAVAAPGSSLPVQDRLARVVLATARAVTGRTQVGSLPTYLAVSMATVVAATAVVLPQALGWPLRLHWADGPGQLLLAAGVAACCAALLRTGSLLTAVLVLSAAGYLVTGLFVLHGAPDLALTQILVETLTLVVLLLVVRQVPRRGRTGWAGPRPVRVLVATGFGAVVMLATAAATQARVPSRVAPEYLRGAPEEGGANVVNVILTEYRALDTLGEVTVLVVAATAVASLVLASTRMGRAPRPGRDGGGGGR